VRGGSEVIMTFGGSVTVQKFLEKAASKKEKKRRQFQVFVAEGAPWFRGREMAISLAEAGLDATLISDSSIFSLMSRVNKVIIGTHAVLANGGLLAPAGTHMVAQAARYYSVPVVVCAGLYKLSPIYPQDQESFNDLTSPGDILQFEEGVPTTQPQIDSTSQLTNKPRCACDCVLQSIASAEPSPTMNILSMCKTRVLTTFHPSSYHSL
jgi:translation initiation factor 2B subunit (eIF-2B alpha/beta/delta family)